jgi:hypothetical protein
MSDALLDDDVIPPPAELAAQFVDWLEARGATLTFRHPEMADWQLNLDGVVDMTRAEAAEIAAAAFEIREAIRAVLVRRGAGPMVH